MSDFASPAPGSGRLRLLCLTSCLVAALFLVALPALWAQGGEQNVHITPRPKPAAPPPGAGNDASLKTHTKPIQVEVDLVLVNVTITDPMNRLVTGLEKENFAVFEGNVPQYIKHFSSEDAPVSLGVIFDMSGSMANKIEKSREAVVEFFKTANPQDEFFLVTFADKPELLADFTKSVEEVQGQMVYT
ncbi:MAG: VWA domain-containing protein, partial [Terriglobales bacterium]